MSRNCLIDSTLAISINFAKNMCAGGSVDVVGVACASGARSVVFCVDVATVFVAESSFVVVGARFEVFDDFFAIGIVGFRSFIPDFSS